MPAPKWPYGLALAVVVAFAVWLFLERQSADVLRAELSGLRDQNKEIAQLRSANTRLAAQRLPAKELENLRDDHVAMSRLRDEIEQLKRRTVELSRTAAATPPVTASATPSTGSITDEMVKASQWRNAGRASAPATMETVLWAGANGDIETLAGSLTFDPTALVKANELLGRLPDKMRNQYRSAEQLIAALTAKDIPQTGARIVLFPNSYPDGSRLVVQLLDASQKTKIVDFALRQEGTEWKVVVPTSAVEKYVTALSEPPLGTAAR